MLDLVIYLFVYGYDILPTLILYSYLTVFYLILIHNLIHIFIKCFIIK